MEKYLYQDLYELEDKHWWHLAKRQTVKSALAKFTKRTKLSILDIGCGAGKNIEELQSFGSVYGLDSSKEAIRFCQKRGLKNLKIGTSSKTGFPKQKFDVITLLDVLEHVEEKNTLKEIHRILKTDGTLLITVPAFQFLWSKWDEVLHHKRRYTTKSLQQVLELNGFTVVKNTYLYSFLFLPVIAIRYLKSLFSKNHYDSDFKLSNPAINSLFTFISNIDRKIAFSELPLPFGTSIVCIAKKNNEK